MNQDEYSRIRYRDLGVNPETGKRRYRNEGLMEEAEYELHIHAVNAAKEETTNG